MSAVNVTTTGADSPPRIPTWAGDLAVILLIVLSTAIPGPRPPFEQQVPVTVVTVVVVVTAVLMPLRRRWPFTVYTVCLSVYVFTVLIGMPALGPGIATVAAVFSLANLTPRWPALATGAFGTVVVVVLSFLSSGQMTVDPQIFQVAAGIAIATALGDSTRSRREYTRAVTERAERAEQTREAEARRQVAEERLRIAQDLHDTVAHRISVISLSAGVASSALDTRPEKAREALGTIRSASREVLGDIGVLLRYLREEDDVPASQMPQPGVDDLDALVASMKVSGTDAGLDVGLNVDGDLAGIDGTTGRVVYRVVQEGLTNAHKHGSGHRASAQVSVGRDTVTVTVTNPVSDTDRNQPDAPRGGLGLTGLRERVSSVGGSVRVDRPDDLPGTFELTAELPRNRKDRL